jgi:hypothetical protein
MINTQYSINIDGFPYWNTHEIINAICDIKEDDIIIGYAPDYFSLLRWKKSNYEQKKDSIYQFNVSNYNDGFEINNKKGYLFPKSKILRLEYRDLSLEDEDYLINFLRRSFKFSDELKTPLVSNTMLSPKEILKKNEACVNYLVDRNWEKYLLNKGFWEITDIFSVVTKYFIESLFG